MYKKIISLLLITLITFCINLHSYTNSNINKLDEKLHWACMLNDLEEVKYLVENGADVNKTDNDGKTPLLMALREYTDNIIIYLVENGADVNKADKHGDTPLLDACSNNSLKIVRYLIENGAQKSINKANNTGSTPLYWACDHNNLELITYLVENGAVNTINIVDDFEEGPLYCACHNNNVTYSRELIHVHLVNKIGFLFQRSLPKEYAWFSLLSSTWELLQLRTNSCSPGLTRSPQT